MCQCYTITAIPQNNAQPNYDDRIALGIAAKKAALKEQLYDALLRSSQRI
jgi:hypothetical protein